LERPREVPRARLVLVQHQHPHVPPSLAQPGQQREQVRLRAGDARHFLEVEDEAALHRRSTVAMSSSAQCSTECRAATAARNSGRRRRSSARSRSARLSGSSGENRSSGGSTSAKIGFEASAGTPEAAASYTTLSAAPVRMLLTSTWLRASSAGTSERGTGPRSSASTSSSTASR